MLSRLLLGRRLQEVELLESAALDNQQIIQGRQAQMKSASVALCRQPFSPLFAFAAGGLTGMSSVKDISSFALVMRIASLAKLI